MRARASAWSIERVAGGTGPTTFSVVLGLLASGCLRAPIGDDQGDGAAEGGSGGWLDDSTGLGASESPVVDDSSEGTTGDPDEDCHPSYSPCLPLVDDLNCSDVIALGAAPVTVIGPDDYGLDADHDGIGCEQ